MLATTKIRVTAPCIHCEGFGFITIHLDGRSVFDPDHRSEDECCEACEGEGELTVMVDDDHPDAVHDAMVDAINK
jgi:hypothetical protein